MTKGMPWQKWDLDDWCDDAELKLCSLDSQALLPRLMQVMSRAEPYGYLLICGREPTQVELSHVIGVDYRIVSRCLCELEKMQVLKRNEYGLYSQRMLSDRDKWLKSHVDGSKGGNPKLVNPPLNPKVNQPLKVDIRTKNKEIRIKNKEQYSPEFESFWSIYPRKIGKHKAYKCWNTLLETTTEIPIMQATGNYAEYTKDREQQFIQYPATFLGPSKAYEDFIDGYPDEGGEDDPEAIREQILQARERVRRNKSDESGGSPEKPPY